MGILPHAASAASLAVGTAGLLALAGCAAPATADDRVSVVASTDVYGDLAARIGGNAVSVTSLITSPAQDPHSYEASAHDELALSRADVVVENGGGYDEFMTSLGDAAGGHATVLDAVDISGRTAAPDGELNEHVWYDVPSVRRLVATLVATLSAADPGHADAFAQRGRELSAGLAALERAQSDVRARYRGTGVAVTEPVPDYLLDACGLVDRTPAAFTSALENGTGVPAGALDTTLHLFSEHRVEVLVYNEQTAGPETDAVRAAARDAGVASVGMTETLPDGLHYLSWMRANLDALAKALA